MGKALNILGLKVGRLTVKERTTKDNYGRYKWLCECECGNTVEVAGYILVQGRSKSCGCYRNEKIHESNFIDLKNKSFGKLTVLRLERMDKRVGDIWVVKCECGSKEFTVRAGDLKSGHCNSCGCMRESFMATELKNYFSKHYTSIVEYKKIKNPKTGSYLKYDIYISDYNVFIEIHGRQHYEYVEHFHKNKQEFKNLKERDKTKKKYANKNGVYIEIDLRVFKDVGVAIDYIEKIIKENKKT